MAARIAAEDVRKGSLPQSPDAYKVELPADFKAPPGVEFKFDEAAPEIKAARAMAHAKGWTQQDFTEALGLFAAAKVNEEAQINAARTAEIGKLGSTAPARVDAVSRFLDANGLGVLKSTMVTAAQVEAWERHITKLSNGGSTGFTPQHRDHQPQGRVTEEEFAKMSDAQRLDYVRSHNPKAA